jgi:hypothetical protein
VIAGEAGAVLEDVALEGEGVGGGKFGIDAETVLEGVPAVDGVAVVGIGHVIGGAILGVDAVEDAVIDVAAVADGADFAVVAVVGLGEESLGVFGVFGDDADDAVDGIGAPEGAAWAADDFDAVEIVEDIIDGVPVDRRRGACRRCGRPSGRGGCWCGPC